MPTSIYTRKASPLRRAVCQAFLHGLGQYVFTFIIRHDRQILIPFASLAGRMPKLPHSLKINSLKATTNSLLFHLKAGTAKSKALFAPKAKPCLITRCTAETTA
jgi:hypothetical protein